jgi:ketosteroid isomerase-like protein
MERVLGVVLLAWPIATASGPPLSPDRARREAMNTDKPMTPRRTNDESDIRRRIDEWAKAIGAMDLERVMSMYAADIVSFDLEPPLQYEGTEAKRKAWARVFATYQPGLSYEIRDLAITIGGDVAFSHSLNRLSGTLKSGRRTGFWVRYTACFRRIGGNWVVAHEQISAPVDPASGRAVLDLEP